MKRIQSTRLDTRITKGDDTTHEKQVISRDWNAYKLRDWTRETREDAEQHTSYEKQVFSREWNAYKVRD